MATTWRNIHNNVTPENSSPFAHHLWAEGLSRRRCHKSAGQAHGIHLGQSAWLWQGRKTSSPTDLTDLHRFFFRQRSTPLVGRFFRRQRHKDTRRLAVFLDNKDIKTHGGWRCLFSDDKDMLLSL